MTSSSIDIKYYGNDAEGFKEIINHLVGGLLKLYRPDEVSIVRIKNWFDYKWLNYSGKKIELYDKNNHPHIPFVLEPYWNNLTTVPPFNPNRVLSESYYKINQVENQNFKEIFHIKQRSTNNRNNFICEKTDNG